MLRASDHQEKKLKTTVSSHLTPVRTAIVNKPAHDSAGKDAEEREARGRLVGVHVEAPWESKTELLMAQPFHSELSSHEIQNTDSKR